nr:immunoglobulin light chain junction region [Macaca mulatta]MOW09727.1 immunoglobulin light chain junction region [Macaca mulatta]MOW10042.1 immunoglobulin light chain junction region [Macaca mulatta]MOW10077.1 immunoglobulin light chain junction region [Macaca mulatta]MOW10485.1 immunoglobulin light chain junction region [Macaca mulatta]
CAQALQTLTF